jgi:acyl-CoA thioester hydrolase
MPSNTLIKKADSFPFSTIMPVRVTDINYGKHLGHLSTIGILHSAWALFLNENGFDELNVEGLGVILLNSSYKFLSESYFNDLLQVNVGIGEFSKLKFNFLFKVINQKSGKIAVTGQEEYAFMDYSCGKVARVPERFLDFCRAAQVK